jgi:hypothetical protein
MSVYLNLLSLLSIRLPALNSHINILVWEDVIHKLFLKLITKGTLSSTTSNSTPSNPNIGEFVKVKAPTSLIRYNRGPGGGAWLNETLEIKEITSNIIYFFMLVFFYIIRKYLAYNIKRGSIHSGVAKIVIISS